MSKREARTVRRRLLDSLPVPPQLKLGYEPLVTSVPLVLEIEMDGFVFVYSETALDDLARTGNPVVYGAKYTVSR